MRYDPTRTYGKEKVLPTHPRQETILGALSRAAERFLRSPDLGGDGLSEFLGELGRAADADRVYVFENHLSSEGRILSSQRFEWAAEDIAPQIDNSKLQSMDWCEIGMERWIEVLSRGGLVKGHIRDLPETERLRLAPQGILSIIVVPIFVAGNWWGFIGFDACREERWWTSLEQDALRTTGAILGALFERRQTDAALRKSEERLELAIGGAEMSMWDVDFSTGRMVADHRAFNAMGYDLGDIGPRAWDWLTLTHPADRGRFFSGLRDHLKGKTALFSIENRFRSKSGEWRWISTCGQVVERDDRGQAVRMTGTSMDVTKRKRAEELLQVQRDLSHGLSSVSNLDEALTLCMDAAMQASGLDCAGVYLVDEKGLHLAVHKGLSTDIVLMACHYSLDSEQARMVLAGRPVYIKVNEFPTTTGRNSKVIGFDALAVLPILHEGNVVACLNLASYTLDSVPAGARNALEAVAAQIGSAIARLRTEEALKDSEERYRSLVEYAPIFIAIAVDGKFVFANEAAVRIVGVPSGKDLIGRSCFRLLDPEVRDVALDRYGRVEKNGLAAPPIVYLYDQPDGNRIAVEISSYPYRFQGHPAVLILGRDVTKRKEAEEEISAYQERLRRMASELLLSEEQERRRIAVNLHDHIGQSLAISKMKLKSLQKMATAPEVSKPLDEACGLVDDMIQKTRSLTLELSPPILYELGLVAALEWLTEKFEEKYGLRTVFGDDGNEKPLADDVQVLLFRSVQELLMNVVKHAQARETSVTCSRIAGNIHIEVRDDGIGWSTGDIPGQANPAGGFGLFSIRERLGSTGGRLNIVSKSGRGVRAAIIAPLKEIQGESNDDSHYPGR